MLEKSEVFKGDLILRFKYDFLIYTPILIFIIILFSIWFRFCLKDNFNDPIKQLTAQLYELESQDIDLVNITEKSKRVSPELKNIMEFSFNLV